MYQLITFNMKTEQILLRPFLTGSVSQNSKTGMFCATDLVKLANIKRREVGKSDFNLSQHLKTNQVREFIEELQCQYPTERIIIQGKGRNSMTWVHPLLFIDIALSVDAKLKISVYKWLQDELLRYRNDSGDSYKKMVGCLYERSSDKRRFSETIRDVAKRIKKSLNVEDWNSASEYQLQKRDIIHENVVLLSSALRDVEQIVRISIENALNR